MTRIVETAFGFAFVLDGITHGHWRSRAEAKGGLAVVLARKEHYAARESAREIAALDAATQEYHEWRNRDQ